ncbi:gluconate 2-dehydrogenase subunit 3 family protein [Chondrinema litorale]|uniref:gluconate 2-dehydrogenase subunit 3 family protein n=1 Tax=Chondrinema litorale TaxID=2994555 RepID=UPI002542A26C|nr:gluconate 2-dehydrogenase subunit 3 family protein [Chondrinema litorale]UZR95733.1 gluconate 2-dehydrogenase subunit 3 family protein [Chondrinema litorale]
MNRRNAVKRISALAGGTLSTPLIAAILNGCKPSEKPDWLPEFLSPEQDQIVIEVSELIIPTTDTPGAKEALVNRYIDLVLKDCYTPEDQKSFLEGINSLNKAAKDEYGNDFVDCEKEEQVALLKKFDEEAYNGANTSGKKPFFRFMKELTVVGYCTSEVGATQALNFVAVPGAYNGCMPYKEGDKAWAI